MKFVITRTSDSDYCSIKNFTTVESLIDFMKQNENPIIIKNNWWYKKDDDYVKEYFPTNFSLVKSTPYKIEIYDDDYRE